MLSNLSSSNFPVVAPLTSPDMKKRKLFYIQVPLIWHPVVWYQNQQEREFDGPFINRRLSLSLGLAKQCLQRHFFLSTRARVLFNIWGRAKWVQLIYEVVFHDLFLILSNKQNTLSNKGQEIWEGNFDVLKYCKKSTFFFLICALRF